MTSAAGELRTARPPRGLALFGKRIGAFELCAIGVLTAAALSPAAPTTGTGIVDPAAYTSLWTIRPGGGPNLLELGLGAMVLVWLVGAGGRWPGRSGMDRALLGLGALVAALALTAALRNTAGIQFLLLDAERIGLVVLGYLVVTRLRLGASGVRALTALMATALAASFTYQTLKHGVFGSTEFGTATGRKALLISEDSLLVAMPAVILWGLVVDRLLHGRRAALAAAFLGVALVVDFLSLRRGALIFNVLAVAVRSLGAPRRWLIGGAALTAVGLALVIAAGPGQSLVSEARYVVESSLLRTADRSTSQRTAEIDNFTRNLHGPADIVLGKGLGAVWNAEVGAPSDAATFGSGETPLVRVGWHVYGLDWAYKLGIVGILGALAVVGAMALQLRRRLPDLSDPWTRSLARSLAVVAPVFLLFTFTNPRVALMAGVSLGLVSRLTDEG